MAGALAGLERRRFRVEGIVQGVGFRPWVHALATRLQLDGYVLNDGDGVVVEAEGEAHALEALATALETETPALAQVDAVRSERLVARRGPRGFRIAASPDGSGRAVVPPDAATCEACLAELFDPADRRHRHPFISCTDCGPRLTIVERIPYDRCNTTMAAFPMCDACRAEYENPADRRFHAEPICCPDCGPRLSMPLEEAVEILRGGGIVAVKGLGGYHLACDATDAEAVARLRRRKRRDAKPFAVMAADPGALADLDAAARELVFSVARPIVLARSHGAVAEAVAPGSPWLGVMAPYTPVHHLLVHDIGRPLVMTSGNRTDEPIAVDDAEARRRLEGIADAFLSHDRAIHRRCEDSVARSEFPVRRSRGHAPGGLPLPRPARRPVIACGAELKSTFCVARGDRAFISPHLGDLVSADAWAAFRSDLALYLTMLDVQPEVVAHDLHPEYLSTKWALELDAEPVGVQHHHAHAAACLAEHGETGPALAVVLDGTGFGTDGTLWGGELLRCDLASFERLAHLAAVPLPGGEAAVREPWRMAASYLECAGRPVPFDRWGHVRQSLAVNAPASSGAGRLLDAVAALLGVRERVSYEGQAAVELEYLADGVAAAPYPCRFAEGVIAGPELVRAAHDDLAAGRPRPEIAAAVHEGLAQAFATACEAYDRALPVVLSGGCLQNLRLLAGLRGRLQDRGFRVLTHRRVPPNDGGISYGQAAVAAARLAPCA